MMKQGIDIAIRNHIIKIQASNKVFTPSKRSLFLANYIEILPCESVIDIGTGTGLLTILSALQGGKCVATDTSAEAIDLALKNSKFNSVDICFHHGSYFCNLDLKFDVITANLPQKWLINCDQLGTNGGNLGTEIIQSLLKQAKYYMTATSRLITLVNTLPDYQSTLTLMKENYEVKLLAADYFNEDKIIRDALDEYLELNRQQKIHIIERDGLWHSQGFCYELKLKGV